MHARTPAPPLGDRVEKLEQAERVCRSTAEVEHASRDGTDIVEGAEPSRGGIIHMQRITHLPAVTVNGDGFATDCLKEEMGDPALVFGAELPRPIDAAHA